jgi:hypothetical protein
VCEQSMAGAEIHDAAAAKETPHAPGGFPGFVQYLARQTSGVTHRPRNTIEKRVAWKAAKITIGEPTPRRGRERHTRGYLVGAGSISSVFTATPLMF